MPGMTATVSVVSQKREDVLRVPAAALRFRPEGFGAGAPGGGRPGGAAGAPGAQGGRRGGQGGQGGALRSPQGDATAGGGRASAAEPDARGGSKGDGGGREGGARSSLIFVLGPDGSPEPRRVQLGLSDGQYVEVISGLEEGATVVTGAIDPNARAAAPRPGASPSTNPFNPQFQRRQR
jgi:multidrug efflux pump subunit AcrA (membrane-fusion protein)